MKLITAIICLTCLTSCLTIDYPIPGGGTIKVDTYEYLNNRGKQPVEAQK